MQTKCVQTKVRHALAVLLFWQIAAYCQTNPPTVLWANCGGENDPPCSQQSQPWAYGLLPGNTPTDGTTSPDSSLRCDRGLLIHYDSSKGANCLNANRMSVSETEPNNSVTTPFLSFAAQSQYGVIQADTPMPFAPIVASHNAFSNYFDGGESELTVDHGYSITDQLQYGARLIRLDPWLFTNWDNQIRLCHSSDLGSISALSLCTSVDPLGKQM